MFNHISTIRGYFWLNNSGKSMVFHEKEMVEYGEIKRSINVALLGE
jgi:hypothetical protein